MKIFIGCSYIFCIICIISIGINITNLINGGTVIVDNKQITNEEMYDHDYYVDKRKESRLEYIAKTIVDYNQVKIPLIIQKYYPYVNNITIDSLVFINKIREPYSGYLSSTFEQGTIKQNICIPIKDIKDEENFLTYTIEWDIETSLLDIFDKSIYKKEENKDDMDFEW